MGIQLIRTNFARATCSIALCVFALTWHFRGFAQGEGADPNRMSYAEEMAGLLGVGDGAGRRVAWDAWERRCLSLDAELHDTERQAACVAMLRVVAATDCPSEMRLRLLRLVERIGGDEAVSELATLLTDADARVVDAARRALMNQGTPRARAALAAALQSADSSERQATLIEAVAYGRDADCCALLSPWLVSEDSAVAQAALRGVVASGSPSALPILLERLAESSAERAESLAAAIVEAARGPAATPETAINGLRALRSDPRLSAEVRAAALRELACRAPRGVVDEVSVALASSERRDQEAGLAVLRELPAEPAVALFALHADWSDKVRAQACAVVGERRLSACGKVLAEIARGTSKAEDRLAAIRALGEVEATAEAAWLVEQLSAMDPKVVAAAEDGLAAYRSDAPDGLLFGRLQQDQGSAVQTLDLMSRRRVVSAVDWALGQVSAEDQAVRSAARNCVARLAFAEQIPRLLTQAESAPREERDEFIRAVVTICERQSAGSSRVAPLLEYAVQRSSGLGQEIILGALGRLGGPQARALLAERLNADEPAIRAAALTALANWPDASVTDELLALAQQAPDADQRSRALRGLARVAVLRGGDKTPAERLAALRTAMSLAERADDRRLVVERAQAVDLWETVLFVRPYLKDPALCDSVCRTIVQVARLPALRAEHPEVLADLEQVVDLCGDLQVVTRAERWLKESRDEQDGE